MHEEKSMTGREILWKDEQKFKIHPHTRLLLTSFTKENVNGIPEILEVVAYYC